MSIPFSPVLIAKAEKLNRKLNIRDKVDGQDQFRFNVEIDFSDTALIDFKFEN